MAKNEKSANKTILQAGFSVGSMAAEFDDDFLLPCFVRYSPATICLDINSPATVIEGRTGSGKTAILKYISSKVDNSIEIDPTEMSMSYVANSDVLNFLQSIGADLDLLFQALWKHVLCIEFIRLKFAVKNEATSLNVFQRIYDRFKKDPRRDRAVKYLKGWEGKFWITMDQNIKEITEKVEHSVKAELGAEIEKFKAGGQYDKRLSADKKMEFNQRIKKIINSDQLAELGSVIEMLKEFVADDAMQAYYILIDRLDENWVDTTLKYRLIRSLIESLRTFKKIRNLKILVALRSDVLERSVQETTDHAFQREKFEDYFVHTKWTNLLLKQLINSRIQNLFRKQYTMGALNFEDIFPHQVNGAEAFDYILERTLMRPRDLIAFVNECLASAEGNYVVSSAMIKKSEFEYSRLRREALEQEWISAFPTIRKLLDFLGLKKKNTTSVAELCLGHDAEELALAIYSEKKIGFDPLYEIAKNYYDAESRSPEELVKAVAGILYRIGAIGIKLQHGDRYLYSHIDHSLLPTSQLNGDSRIRIHKMLWGAYRLHETPDVEEYAPKKKRPR